MRRLPSASSLERAFACPPSQVLPHLKSLGSPLWSRRGSVIHRFLERCAHVGRDAALDEVPRDLYDACACIEVEKLPPATAGSYAFEVSLALDLETGQARELCRGEDRETAYALARPDELVGTVDVLGLTEDAVWVLDYKTGYRWWDDVSANFQLMWYALAACRAYGRDQAWLAIIRIDQDGHPYFIWAHVTVLELDAFAARLLELDDAIADLQLRHLGGEALQPVTGDHCQYCPAVHGCPAWMKLARSMTSPEDDGPGLPELTAESAPLYIEAVKRGKKVLERIEKALDIYAEQAPIELGGGWVYGQHPFHTKEWDVGVALPILTGYLGEEEAASTVKAEIIQKRIMAIYRQRKETDKKVRIGKDTETLLAALENQGAFVKVTTYPIGRHRPTPELTEGAENGKAAGQEEAGDGSSDVAGAAHKGGTAGARPEAG